jgi:protein ImuB
VVARIRNAPRILAADANAQRLGLGAGLALADARARVPQLRVSEHDAGADAALLGRMADWCERFSPIVALSEPNGLMLDITGVTHLFGGEGGLVGEVTMRFVGQGFALRTAIAGTAAAARALCRYGRGGILRPGAEAEAMAGLPVEALEIGADIELALKRAGLPRIGDLAARPRKPLAARFSSELTNRLAGILGEIDRPLTPRRPEPLLYDEMGFADPIGLMDDIAAALEAVAVRLCATLERRAMGGRVFEASFYRADGAVRRVELLSGQPLRVAKTLVRLLLMRLDALADPLDPGFGFDAIRIAVLGADAAQPGQGRLDGSEEALLAVGGLRDRLAARLGPQAVQRFVPGNSHVPERAVASVPALSDRKGPGAWRKTQTVPMRPLQLFHPPQPIEMVAVEVPDGPPRRFRWRGAVFDVMRAEGPERIAPEWWRPGEDGRSRDYFRVEDRNGRRFWLFRHGLYERPEGAVRWYIQGLFA